MSYIVLVIVLHLHGQIIIVNLRVYTHKIKKRVAADGDKHNILLFYYNGWDLHNKLDN
jgi:hypothetical protein